MHKQCTFIVLAKMKQRQISYCYLRSLGFYVRNLHFLNYLPFLSFNYFSNVSERRRGRKQWRQVIMCFIFKTINLVQLKDVRSAIVLVSDGRIITYRDMFYICIFILIYTFWLYTFLFRRRIYGLNF